MRGLVGEDLTPEVVARYAAALGQLVRCDGSAVVVARDSRTSGPMFANAVTAGLASVGMGVIDWHSLVVALRDVGYDGVLSLELAAYEDPHYYARSSLDYLKRVLSET